MAKCSRCDGFGYEVHDEDNRRVQDTCYHCAGAGEVEPEVDQQDRLLRVARSIAIQFEKEYRTARDNDPEGEGYEFCAAENMMSVHDYFEDRVSDRKFNIIDQLNKLDSDIQKVLLEWHEKLNSPAARPVVSTPSPNAASAPVVAPLVTERMFEMRSILGDDDIPF